MSTDPTTLDSKVGSLYDSCIVETEQLLAQNCRVFSLGSIVVRRDLLEQSGVGQ